MNMTQPIWARKFRPRKGECLLSIAARLAPMGRLQPDELTKLVLGAESLAAVPLDDAAIARLAVVAGMDEGDLRKRCGIPATSQRKKSATKVTILGRTVPTEWVTPDKRRIAPSIFAAEGADCWVRTIWQISAFPCDPTTGEALLSNCPTCGTDLHWMTTNRLWECGSCRADLTKKPKCVLPADTVTAARELAGFFGNGPTPVIPSPFDRLPDVALCELLG